MEKSGGKLTGFRQKNGVLNDDRLFRNGALKLTFDVLDKGLTTWTSINPDNKKELCLPSINQPKLYLVGISSLQ